MLIDQIISLWEKDSEINRMDIAGESLNIPLLHSKYLRMHVNEKIELNKLNNIFKKVSKLKRQYYNGQMSKSDLEKYGWEQFQLKVLKQDIQYYIDGDEDLIKIQDEIDIQQEKVNMLDQIIRNINARNFIIKNYIDWQKFENGVV